MPWIKKPNQEPTVRVIYEDEERRDWRPFIPVYVLALLSFLLSLASLLHVFGTF